MSKKYMLIREYPGSLDYGAVVEYSKMYNTYFPVEGGVNNQLLQREVELYPDHWAEIIEKTFEIVSFLNNENKGIYTKLEYERYYFEESGRDLEFCNKYYTIHSIKRLSDGEIFTIGDKVCWDWTENNSKYFTIVALRLSFKLDEVVLEFEKSNVFEGLFNDKKFNFRHYKKALFTTEDGVEVFKGDKVYYVETGEEDSFNFQVCEYTVKVTGRFTSDETLHTFSTKEAAEEYIKMNKPEFSRNQILELLEKLKNK